MVTRVEIQNLRCVKTKSTVPTVVVHGGAGSYANITTDNEAKEDIENGKS